MIASRTPGLFAGGLVVYGLSGLGSQHANYDRYYAKRHLSRSFNVRGKARSFRRLLTASAVPVAGVDVLDIGFGAGAMLLQFDTSCRLVGLDSSRTAVERMKHLAQRQGFSNTEFIVWDGAKTRLPFSEESFDIAIASHILEHIAGDVELVVEAHRVLRRGGHFVVMLPLDDPTTLARNPDHLRIYTPQTAVSLLSAHEFEVIASAADHKIENLLLAISTVPMLDHTPRLRSRLVGAASLMLSLLPACECLPFPGPHRNLGLVAKKL